jgi:hypothetical protein
MESDDFGVLSAPVYAKSFIKMYAKYLGLDGKPLVDEYVAQHAPWSKPNLGEESRQKLAKADQVSADSDVVAAVPPARGGNTIFGGVNEAIARMSESKFSPGILIPVIGGLLLLAIIIFSVTQCSDNEEKTPAAAGGAALVDRQLITDGAPNVYLGQSGGIEVDRK